jgi:hypothetical protein
MHRQLLVAAGLFGMVAMASVAAAQDTAGGRNSAFAEVYIFDLDVGGGPPAVEVTIPRGKANRMLLADATMVSNEFGPTSISVGVLVNGIPMHSADGAVASCSIGEFGCTASGHWWMDLDAAEAANPGLLIGQPLVLRFYATEETGTGAAGLSVRAWMQKK